MRSTEAVAWDHIWRAHDVARDDLRRADTKAQTLLSLVTAILAGVIALATRSVSPIAMVALWLAVAPIFAVVLLLLSAIRPRLSDFPPAGSWLHAVKHGPGALVTAAQDAQSLHELAADVVLLGDIAVVKYRRIGRAVGGLFAGLSLLSVGLVLAVLL